MSSSSSSRPSAAGAGPAQPPPPPPDASFVDYYALLGIPCDADDAAIKRAYRKRALELHPDKNPDNPKAEDLFLAVKQASDALLDKEKRAEHDAKIASRAAATARTQAMDSKRAKLREDLEARERAASSAAQARDKQAANLASEIERLRKEGQARQQAYAEEMNAKRRAASAAAAAAAAAAAGGRGVGGGRRMAEEEEEGAEEDAAGIGGAVSSPHESFDIAHAVRATWTQQALDALGDEGSAEAGTLALSEGRLTRLFKLYGKIVALAGRKRRSACIVFDSTEAVEAAIAVPPDGFRVTRLVSESGGEGMGEGEGEEGRRGRGRGTGATTSRPTSRGASPDRSGIGVKRGRAGMEDGEGAAAEGGPRESAAKHMRSGAGLFAGAVSSSSSGSSANGGAFPAQGKTLAQREAETLMRMRELGARKRAERLAGGR